ncbi:MAG: hypothetical protein HGA19_13555 [Oscillochloris sp.]|nr:hypothetical protein [Oscillochloris sp.]
MVKLPDSPVQRMHYFDHQFLRAADFTVEQDYDVMMRRLHNSALHTAGIADGLTLLKVGDGLRVTHGIGFDGDGKEIILVKDRDDVDLTSKPDKIYFVSIAYAEQETDATDETGVKGNTRVTESPLIEVLDTLPNEPNQAGKRLVLGQVKVAGGKLSADPDMSPATGRKAAGVIAGDLNANSVRARQVTVDTNLTVSGGVNITGDIIASGRVDGRDVSADGTRLDQHVTNTNNPHATTAAQVGALPINGGGTVTGNVTLLGLVQNRNTTASTAMIVANRDNPTTVGAVLNAVSGTSGVLGLYVRSGAFTGTPQQHAANHALRIDGDLLINGAINTTGSKAGYVVDTFINASGQRLRTGDVVRLKGTPVVRFTGLNNKIPIVEITLADQANDGRIIGIVDQEVPPSGDVPDRRTEPDDPTFVDDGGEVQVVTLGTYAHCKVDANSAPIEVGDLLTSSANPGYAMKASEPRLGSIIAKALEPLKEGTGYIAVFVNIQ